MEVKEKIIKEYVQKYNFPNAKVIDHHDLKLFDYYSFDNIPYGLGLADCIEFDENNELKYGFLKNHNGEEMNLIVGYTGSGKSQHHLLQQIRVAVQRGHSAIVTDTSGQLIDYCYSFLEEKGVNVKILNFGDTKKSDHYNPLYVEAVKCKNAKKLLDSTEELVENISKLLVHTDSKDPSWSMGARNFIKGLILGCYEEVINGIITPEDVTLYNIIQQFFWLRREVVNNRSTARLSEIEYYESKDPLSKSIQNIAPIAENADVTRAGYLGIAYDYLSTINNQVVFDITSSNNIDITDLWKKQTVIFINTADKSCGDMISSLLVNQLYALAMDEAMKTVTKRLPRVIQVFLDEFANIQFTDNKQFEKMLTTIRKFQIFFNMYVQSFSQLETKFGHDTTSTILSNCTLVFLGTRDYESRQQFATSCGKKTIESIDSYCTDAVPKLVTVDVLTAEELGKLEKGQMYILRQGFDVIKTYFEAAYKCKEFQVTKTYNHKFTSQPYDYEKNIIIQPLMIKKIDIKKLNEKNLYRRIKRQDIEEYEFIITNNKYIDLLTMRKLERLGVLKHEDGKYIGLIDPLIIEKAKSASPKRTPFDFDF